MSRIDKILERQKLLAEIEAGLHDGAPPPELPTLSRREQQMAEDLHEIRRKQSIEFYAPGIGLLLFLGMIYWFLRV